MAVETAARAKARANELSQPGGATLTLPFTICPMDQPLASLLPKLGGEGPRPSRLLGPGDFRVGGGAGAGMGGGRVVWPALASFRIPDVDVQALAAREVRGWAGRSWV
jgi:hypothetical protein